MRSNGWMKMKKKTPTTASQHSHSHFTHTYTRDEYVRVLETVWIAHMNSIATGFIEFYRIFFSIPRRDDVFKE